jgi:hypothetical protein
MPELAQPSKGSFFGWEKWRGDIRATHPSMDCVQSKMAAFVRAEIYCQASAEKL